MHAADVPALVLSLDSSNKKVTPRLAKRGIHVYASIGNVVVMFPGQQLLVEESSVCCRCAVFGNHAI